MTYSIVARDPETGELGIAIQSKWFSVGRVALWTNAGVGVVATQALADPTYGAKGLTLMRVGLSAHDALDSLRKLDDGREHRQVAMLDASGQVATFTGEACIDHASHVVRGQASAQGNLLAVPRIPHAMMDAFERATGDLAHRLIVALEAAEREGGDARGSQSAALITVTATGSQDLFADRPYDLRIDDHPTPIAEMRRLIEVQSAYRFLEQSTEQYAIGEMDAAASLAIQAFELMPGDTNVAIWGALAVHASGDVRTARELICACEDVRVDWTDMFGRLQKSGALPEEFDLVKIAPNLVAGD